jgi:type I restriction enzyme R subunit
VSEADTCRKLVVPKLLAGGWDTDPHSIAEQRSITDGRIVPVGKGFIRKPPKRVDFLLRYTRDFPLAVVEAKASYKAAADSMQQAKTYAEMLGLKFAYATNGHDIIEFDYLTGIESIVRSYPTPDELWQRYRKGRGLSDNNRAERLLTPSNHVVGKGERYYQQIAINRTMEAILKGERRLLLTMATGTGKTAMAFQICWKLLSGQWRRLVSEMIVLFAAIRVPPLENSIRAKDHLSRIHHRAHHMVSSSLYKRHRFSCLIS